jgi:hypothetical protein
MAIEIGGQITIGGQIVIGSFDTNQVLFVTQDDVFLVSQTDQNFVEEQ